MGLALRQCSLEPSAQSQICAPFVPRHFQLSSVIFWQNHVIVRHHSHAELLELQLVLETGAQFFDDAAQSASAAHSERADDAGAPPIIACGLLVVLKEPCPARGMAVCLNLAVSVALFCHAMVRHAVLTCAT